MFNFVTFAASERFFNFDLKNNNNNNEPVMILVSKKPGSAQLADKKPGLFLGLKLAFSKY